MNAVPSARRSPAAAWAIGVSNFQANHPRRLEIESHPRRLEIESEVTPAVNQIELHPCVTQEKLRAFNNGNAIATETWSPIA